MERDNRKIDDDTADRRFGLLADITTTTINIVAAQCLYLANSASKGIIVVAH